MPAKSSPPEAAQKRVWKAELQTCNAHLKVLYRDFKRAHRCADKECAIALRAAEIARAAHRKTKLSLAKSEARETAAIIRRICLLKGRIAL